MFPAPGCGPQSSRPSWLASPSLCPSPDRQGLAVLSLVTLSDSVSLTSKCDFSFSNGKQDCTINRHRGFRNR
ncbi:hypothetical protein I79_025825 [Cricetulus griseus]|uniref:Uncharacterized protein n=1 Tax=Cricetulus griseus TaxID=10029 RepID=G3IPB9_CRIGR|nr:hypothetical protein I79_025825 [Cricetulus griseus]